MSSQFGSFLRLSLFGQSHGEAIGITLDGFPAGLPIDMDALAREMARRAPGQSALSTPRKEADAPEFLSGVLNGVTTGQPLCAIIRNTNQHSKDYGSSVDLARPAHADYTGHVRYFGFEDWRGGGSFSGRLTAPIVLAGALCKQYLAAKHIKIESHVLRIGQVTDIRFSDLPADADLSALPSMPLPVLQQGTEVLMEQEILAARSDGDSVGGQVECRVTGLPVGLGAPFFDSVESILSHLMFSIPGVKGIDFGSGFTLSQMRGSEANDAFRIKDGQVVTSTNHAGGINGGITNGMEVLFTCAIRPTPSIAQVQQTVSLQNMKEAELTIHGRHDPCILSRVTPVVEAMAAIGIMELWKERASCVK